MKISKFLFLLATMLVMAMGGYAQGPYSLTASAQRSGRMELRVWDIKTKHFIYAGLGIYPVKVRHKKWASMSTATGDIGSAQTLTLSPGTYSVKVERYLCNGKNYFSDKPRSFTFIVRAGRRLRKTLSVDVSRIRAKRSYDNPGGERCFN